ncbi:MAG: fumarylacetoacetate hydrolase family protein [Bacillota bacterium]
MNLIDKGFEHLWKAETEKVTVAPLTEMFPNLTVEEAYQIQLKVIEKKVQQGQRIVGKKIGLTSLAMQQLLGVDQPDYGHLLDRMEVKKGQPVPVEGLFKPRIEAEVAFVLKQDLRGPGITIEDVYEATDYIVPSFEVVDSRITNWRIKLADTIADNASSGLFLLGEQKFKVEDVDLPSIKMDLYKNGEYMNTGYGTDVLGNPAFCVAWLANKLAEYNIYLNAGEVILSGALSAALDVEKGDHFRAVFTQLGEIEIQFI